VVGHRQEIEPVLKGLGNQFLRGQCTIRVNGVAVQLAAQPTCLSSSRLSRVGKRRLVGRLSGFIRRQQLDIQGIYTGLDIGHYCLDG
jgi:hypothetical protein